MCAKSPAECAVNRSQFIALQYIIAVKTGVLAQ